jgi:serine protease Do
VGRAVSPPSVLAPGNLADDAARTPSPSLRDPVPLPEGSDEAIYASLSRQYDQFHQVNRTFELVSKVVSRSVVHIIATKHEQGENGRPSRATFEESGSGVIVRSEKKAGLFVLTNNHVVETADPKDISISLFDRRVIRPVEVWSDSSSDIAVLRLAQDDLPAARLGDSDDAVVGSWVLALGSPFGLTHSVSQGIISARGRSERDLLTNGVINQDFLQTDAAINPGNSGGPLVNLKGEVIGVNTAIASQSGGNEGVGYSIPINLARWAMDQLLAQGRVRRGAMGVRLEDLFANDLESLGLDRPRGARIFEVTKASPADKGGIVVGDVIVEYNGIVVLGTNHLINLVAMTPIGQTAELVVLRGNKPFVTSVVVGDRDAALALMPTAPSPVLPSAESPASPAAVTPNALQLDPLPPSYRRP